MGLHVDDGLVRGTVEAQAAFYEGLAVRFKFKTPTYVLDRNATTQICRHGGE